MQHVFKIRVNRSVDTVPKGFELQVVSNSSTSPSGEEIQRALIAAGFPNAHSSVWSSRSNYDIIFKS